MRLVDADALDMYECLRSYYGVAWRDAQKAIDDAPTVDAVEVVRCKGCKYYLNSNEKCGLVDTRLRFYETDKVWTEDSFCSWGERREDEKTD